MPSPFHLAVGLLMALVAVKAIQDLAGVWVVVAVVVGVLIGFCLYDVDRRR
jgi:DMSO reductase anchor subunit